LIRKIKFALFSILFLFNLVSCQNNQPIQKLSTPCKLGGEPNLHISKEGKAMLSWVEYLNDTTDVLAFSTLEAAEWSAPKIIAKGTNWFVNWADFPSLVTYEKNSNHLAAHWLQKSAIGTYDYDVRIAQSVDGGQNWQPSFVPHTDGISAEHGFVSMLPVGAMTLRSAFFNTKGKLSGEMELDNKVCDCCATSAAITNNGVIVAYRDRSEEEIRDISIVRQIGQDWTRPRSIHSDNWEIAGCPVNGPKIISDGKTKVAVAWYTMANDTPKVQVVLSTDSGANFGKAIRIDDGNPLGRVDLVFGKEHLIVSWLENEGSEIAAIRVAKVNQDGVIEKKMTITKTSVARSSGFPILEKLDNQLLMAWTEILNEEEETTTVASALINF